MLELMLAAAGASRPSLPATANAAKAPKLAEAPKPARATSTA